MRNTIRLAYDHLTKDKVMSFLIDKFRDKIDWSNRYNSNYPLSIANLIIEQQISFKAAITVKKRFAKIVDKKSQSEIMNMSNTDLQSIGISFRKAEYIKNVFRFFKNKTIDFPLEKIVPPFCKKQYRDLNAKLNIALMVPENLMCEKRLDLLKTTQMPMEFMIRNKKYLERENLPLNLRLDNEKMPLSYIDYKNNSNILKYLKFN